MKNRSELREIIVKVIYQILILKDSKLDYDIDSLINEFIEIENDFVTSSVNEIYNNLDTLKDTANKYLSNWKLSRLNRVDQAIILLGVYELMLTKTPGIVSINEAVELSKKYSDEKVTSMINATLDKIYHNEADQDE